MASILTHRSVAGTSGKVSPQEAFETANAVDCDDLDTSIDSSERLGTLGKVDAFGHRQLQFLPRKNVPWHHEFLGNISIFLLSVWWIFGCACPGVIVILALMGWYVSAAILLVLSIYPMVIKIQPWPLFRWFMAKGGHPLDLYAKKGYCITFQNGAYEAIARCDPKQFLSKSNHALLQETSESSSKEEVVILASSNSASPVASAPKHTEVDESETVQSSANTDAPKVRRFLFFLFPS